MITTWKDKKQLPIFKRLTKYKFDIDLLVDSYNEINNSSWNSMDNEYLKFTQTHKIVTQNFDDEYQQYGLTTFDDNFNLNQRTEKSGSIWDRKIAKNNHYADERFYRKRKNDIPQYISHVLNVIGKDITHKTRFARLPANKQIQPHIDHDTKYGIRLHIPIITNELSIFGGIDNDGNIKEQHFPADGSVWFINPGLKHWVRNDGNSERVHLIISCDSQEILNEN